MSDFIDNLFSRSFQLDGDSQSVRPRLPSLFETAMTGRRVAIATSVAGPEQKANEIGVVPREEQDEYLAPLPHRIDYLQSRPSSHHTRVDDATIPAKVFGQSPSDEGVGRDRHNPADSTKSNIPDEPIQPLSKAVDQGLWIQVWANRDQTSEPPQKQAMDSDLSAPTAVEAHQPIRLTQDQRFLKHSETNNAVYPSGVDRGGAVNPSVLEVIVKGHMPAYAAKPRNSDQGHDADPTSTRKPIPRLAPAETAKLNLQWPKAGTSGLRCEAVTASAEPTINVTIGRIEIRATQAAPVAARKSQTAKPAAMSLDDYLNKRNGGAR